MCFGRDLMIYRVSHLPVSLHYFTNTPVASCGGLISWWWWWWCFLVCRSRFRDVRWRLRLHLKAAEQFFSQQKTKVVASCGQINLWWKYLLLLPDIPINWHCSCFFNFHLSDHNWILFLHFVVKWTFGTGTLMEQMENTWGLFLNTDLHIVYENIC